VSTSSPPGSGPTVASAVLVVAVLAVVVLAFALVYLTVTPIFNALIDMGVIALVLALVAYLAQAFSRDPVVQRSLGWGLGAMGFVLLLVTVWVEPAQPKLSTVTQLEATFVVLIVFVIAVALAVWRTRSVAVTERREEHRAQWDRSRPASAFDYAAAHAPGTSGVGSPPAESPPARSP